MRQHVAEPPAGVTALDLVGVLLLARVLGLVGREFACSPWLLPALVWHDVAVGAAFAVWINVTGGGRPTTVVYWLLVVWSAVGVVVVRALATPLTVPMLRASGGALADSVGHYVTAANLLLIAAVVTAGAILPRLRVPRRVGRVVSLAGLAVAAFGPYAESQVDVKGASRNAMTALVATALPRVSSAAASPDVAWRDSPFGPSRGPGLDWLRGVAGGRHVVLIVLESTGAAYLRSYGAADDPMPALTALAEDAIQFDAAYAVYPESIKGLFSLLCSRHPAIDISVETHAGSPCAPLTGTLNRAGYQSALFHAGRFSYLGMEAVLAQQGFHTLADAAVIGGQVESSFGVDEPSVVRAMLSWIDRRDRARPFFLAYLPAAGHHPYATPEPGPFEGEGIVSDYKNALRHADRAIASLLDGLRERHLYDHSVIVIVGDHGEAFGEHDGNFGHPFFAFEENVHVPLFVVVPGITQGLTRVPHVASVVDIAPTMLDMLGLPIADAHEGHSLLDGEERLAYFMTDYALGWAGLRDRCWKYLLQVEASRSMLFHVCTDPRETRDVSGTQASRVRRYRERTAAWLGAVRARYSETSPQRDRPVAGTGLQKPR